MLGTDYPKIHAQHIEAPARPFLCEYHHAAYRPHGAALAIARYHHFRHGPRSLILENIAA